MTHWEFGETREDGEAWLSSPQKFMGLVQFQVPASDGAMQWYRISVVTRGWVEAQLRDLATWAAWPGFLVIADGSPAQLRASIDRAFEDGSLRHWANAVSEADLTPRGV